MGKLSTIAAKLGRRGGKARAKKLTPSERTAIARKAVNERWRRWRERNEAEKNDEVLMQKRSD